MVMPEHNTKHKADLRECVSLMKTKLMMASEVINWWKAKGYKDQTARLYATQCYKLNARDQEVVESTIGLHLTCYDTLIQQCQIDGDRKNLLRCLERREKLLGLEAPNRQELKVSPLSDPIVIRKAQEYLKSINQPPQ